MADWRSMRASGTDRERAADLLRAAHADGRVQWQDYSTRLEQLMSSTTHGEIHQVVGDLVSDHGQPDGEQRHSGPGPAPATGPRASGGRNRGRVEARPSTGPVGATTFGPAGFGASGNVRPRHGPARRTTTDRMASAAVICGTLVPFTVGISGIPAILLGHLARRRLKAVRGAGGSEASEPSRISGNEYQGNSLQLATAGLVLGYIPVLLGMLLALFLLTR